MVILRRRLKEGMAIAGRDGAGQLALGFVEIGPGAGAYEYGVLITSLDEEGSRSPSSTAIAPIAKILSMN